MSTGVLVVADPSDRRWHGFSAAAQERGLRARCASWLDVLDGAALDVGADDLVRLDAVGDDVALDARLCGRLRRRGEVIGAAAWAAGLGQAAESIERRAPGRMVPGSAEVQALGDKSAYHRRLREAGVPVPPALARPSSFGELEAGIAAAGWGGRAFVKIRHGSSASGVAALAFDRSRGRVRLRAHFDVHRDGGDVRLLNTLALRTIDDPRTVAEVVDLLCAEGVHVEAWVPKLSIGGHPVDLRVVCVAGRATHAVGRSGIGPMTNLHLGGRRVPADEVRRRAPSGFDAAIVAAEAAAAAFPGCLHLGVDVGIEVGGRAALVFEANAFGDLLPGLGGLDGTASSTWDAEVDALVAGWRPPKALG